MANPICIPRKEVRRYRPAKAPQSIGTAKSLKHSPSYINITTIKHNKASSPPHPLINMSKSLSFDFDSDNDSCNSGDESFDTSSISSYNDSIYSVSPLSVKSKIRSKSSVSNCTATATPSKPSMSSASSLSRLLERQNIYRAKPVPDSIKKSYLNDDFQILNLIQPHDEVEMKTYKFETYDGSDTERLNCRMFRNRDERINANFLKLYALDYNARMGGTLPQTSEINEALILSDGVRQFHHQHNLFRISNLSKEKLWNNIILDPRPDSCPSSSIDYSNYVYVGSDNDGNTSITMKHGNYLPWSCKSSLKPSGLIPGKFLVNGSNPNSGVTKSQYTIKGWCNCRWLADETNDNELR